MLNRRRFCGLLLGVASTALGSALTPERAVAQHGPFHGPGEHPWGPPWHRPVASSRTIESGGARIQLDFSPGTLDLASSDIVAWVERAARAVTVYYGHFPVPRERIIVVFVPGQSGVFGGTTWGGVDGFPAFTQIHVGQHTTERQLIADWTMTHEMVHTAFPSQPDSHHWIEEGLATYVEPVARVQAGFLTAARIWGDMVRDMPQGDPQLDDQGLDRTHTWGRTYWGGAQFCLLADVTIREQTRNRKGLQDALRAIVDSGGTIDTNWPLNKALAVGDEATGTTVLTGQYNRMKDTPVRVNLKKLWRELGVERGADGGVLFNAAAPYASICEAITKTPGT
ncbi:MAG TPA: hypothetical protein VME86_16815 [Acidobacteriaceae bacterium]|nr:hypothetical protein [Acidobacteriaceae bacterium]